MDGLDDTDREILRLLVVDGRRPYSEIAEAVDLSGPAVSERVSRLREIGVIERFTVALDRSRLSDGVTVLVSLHPEPDAVEAIRSGIAGADATEHVFETADGRVIATARVPDRAVRTYLEESVALDRVREYDVDLLSASSWSPGVGEATFAPDCAECGNTVTVEGTARTLGDETYQFCCESCASAFERRYRDFEADA